MFMNERFSGSGITSYCSNYDNRQGQEEGDLDQQHNSSREYEQFQPDAEWFDDTRDDVRYVFSHADDCDHSTEHYDHHCAKDDGWTGQTHDSGAAAVVGIRRAGLRVRSRSVHTFDAGSPDMQAI